MTTTARTDTLDPSRVADARLDVGKFPLSTPPPSKLSRWMPGEPREEWASEVWCTPRSSMHTEIPGPVGLLRAQ